ncbi:MGH1-like glycoside hydrolase domain-containing protein [Segatella bryantii]|uniref:MGH1-like glycoside hydrolase domain-containing protein n=1 Tax=Segatella bryantii TaxID=77095 RepID=UPI0024324031|nr:glycosyl hydrolase family 65 protein [Segatella bryantii]
MNNKLLPIAFALSLSVYPVYAQQLVRYTGTQLSDPNRHDGGLSPVMGVHNIQILRANREHPSVANGNGWTYNHQPMMAYWRGRFYVHYLCDPKDEQVPPSHTNYQVSKDGYTWSDPIELFPEYNVPEGFSKKGVDGVAHNMKAVMHQRMGWYISSEGRLYALGSYGVCLNKKDHNNDGNGIGRVIREVKADGKLGKIYFIYYNHDFNEKNTDYPFYTHADKHLKKACKGILANPRLVMQWVEEADREDPILPLKKEYKAYNDYTLPDGRIVALWKHALTSISSDGGKTWLEPVNRAEGFVNSNAKIWGQRLSDGSYATLYNPSEFRWPLAISLSKDGLEYTTLNLVNGEVPPIRYGGNYKSRGPQYVRGILEGNGEPADSNLWVSYSMNKEDMWVARIPVPVLTEAHAQADDDFTTYKRLADLTTWNIYSPKEAPVSLDGEWLTLSDSDKFDYSKVERLIPASKDLTVEFDLKALQNNHGTLEVEFIGDNGIAAARMELTPDGLIQLKNGARNAGKSKYEANKVYHLKLTLSVARRRVDLYSDGKLIAKSMFFAPAHTINRVLFRTGEYRTFPTVDTEPDWYGTLEQAGESDSLAVFKIAHFKTTNNDIDAGAALLQSADYKHYVDYFNGMEDENIVQAIPNSESWKWMQENIPLFDAPDKSFEQMWYYRWWTLRKHIEKTPVGYAMTEFLVKRSYADQYNLISSGLGHHIHESRWLRNPIYLDQNIHTWLFGNNGQAMKKLNFYSSWLAQSVWDRYLVDGRKDSVVALLPALIKEVNRWDDHRWEKNGKADLYWQYDVKDAMEETISGGRRAKNARPSINSYMYGNFRAIANIAALAKQQSLAKSYTLKADTLKRLIETELWNDSSQFFEVKYPSGDFAKVREAIGFMPWYVNMFDTDSKFDIAWKQAGDSKGFSAPYGQTTAEQRHPQFRSHGTGKCEWDGAVWPFATAQTLTGMANYLNVSDKPVISDSLYFVELEKYVQSQTHRGKPYIGEYLDEQTGYWLKGDQERSRYYNHSTFNDLVITGLCGLRPREDNNVEVNPLLPQGKWSYFCVDNILYHGHRLAIVWDQDGSRYHVGKGLSIWIDGVCKARRQNLGRLSTAL